MLILSFLRVFYEYCIIIKPTENTLIMTSVHGLTLDISPFTYCVGGPMTHRATWLCCLLWSVLLLCPMSLRADFYIVSSPTVCLLVLVFNTFSLLVVLTKTMGCSKTNWKLLIKIVLCFQHFTLKFFNSLSLFIIWAMAFNIMRAVKANIHCVPKKVEHQTHADNSVSSWQIFKIHSLLERELNFKQKPYNTSHHTFSVLPHYLANVRSLNFGKSGRKYKRKCNMHWFLNSHPILMHLAYLLFQFLVPVKYFL